MGRPANAEPTVRLNLEIAKRVRDRLERLKHTSGADSLTEVIRRALTVYDVLLQVGEEGSKLVVHHRDGSKETLRIV